MRAHLVPRRLRTEARFQAPDPVYGNRDTEFSIESYIYVLEHADERSSLWRAGNTPVFGLRSEIDGAERFLPDSLSHLWRSGRVPPEALPGLLQEIAPRLRKSDYLPMLYRRSRRLAIFGGFLLLLLIGFLLTWPRGTTPASTLDAMSAEEWLAGPPGEPGRWLRLRDELPVEGRLEESVSVQVPKVLQASPALSWQLGWVRGAEGPRLALLVKEGPPLPVEPHSVVWTPEELGVPGEAVERAKAQMPDLDTTRILAYGWQVRYGKAGFPFLPLVLGISLAAGLLTCLLFLPLIVTRWNRRKRQMEWALARLGGGHG